MRSSGKENEDARKDKVESALYHSRSRGWSFGAWGLDRVFVMPLPRTDSSGIVRDPLWRHPEARGLQCDNQAP